MGWRMPEGAVYVGRPSRWGNPFRVGDNYYFGDAPLLIDGALVDWPVPTAGEPGPRPYGGRVETATGLSVVRWYGPWVESMLAQYPGFLAPLRGRDLACWCVPLCGVPVNLYDVPGSPEEPCTRDRGHDGWHDPSVSLWCHADVLLELANR